MCLSDELQLTGREPKELMEMINQREEHITSTPSEKEGLACTPRTSPHSMLCDLFLPLHSLLVLRGIDHKASIQISWQESENQLANNFLIFREFQSASDLFEQQDPIQKRREEQKGEEG